MNSNPTCRVLVVEDNAGLPHLVHSALASNADRFSLQIAHDEADANAKSAEARKEGRPYAVAIFGSNGSRQNDFLLNYLADNIFTDAVFCCDDSGPVTSPRVESPSVQPVVAAHNMESLYQSAFQGRVLNLPRASAALTLRGFIEFAAAKQRQALQTQEQLSQTQSRLAATQEQYRLLFDNCPIPIYTYDQTTFAFLAVNEAAIRLYGYGRDEFLQLTLLDLAQPQDIPAFKEKLSKLSITAGNSGVWRHRVRAEKFVEVELTSHALSIGPRRAWLSVIIDVTERSNLEAQFRQAQKMESVGQLASGIAHDFNNLLTVISGHVGMLMAGPPLAGKGAGSLREISEATKRASDLTRQLMTFSRRQELHLQVVDLNEVVNNFGKMLRRILGEDISLNMDFSPGLPSVKADPGMLEQVLMNLAVNSRDAMPHGGQLVISTSPVTIDDSQARLNPESSPGQFICLTFSDTGSGIPPEILSRIFEPFFTTKEKDRGTGLGLATVYGIVKQHQGWIQVTSKVGRGTTFQIHLRAYHEKSASAVAMSTGEQRVIGGTETLLLVEDEEPLLRLMHHILESFGYKVLDATTGKEAVAQWNQHKKRIDLLLTDLVLPDGMTGPELAKILKTEKPGLRIVFTSGFNRERLDADPEVTRGANFLQKPFHVRKLAEMVFDTLRERPI